MEVFRFVVHSNVELWGKGVNTEVQKLFVTARILSHGPIKRIGEGNELDQHALARGEPQGSEPTSW